MVEKDLSRLILNKNENLSFEIINELKWTKVYFNSNNSKEYLGAYNYEEIIKKLKEGIFHNIRPKIINIDKQKMKIVPQKIVTFKGYRIYSILTLMDPYFCIYRTTEEKTGKLFFQDSNVEFIKEIGIDWNLIRFE